MWVLQGGQLVNLDRFDSIECCSRLNNTVQIRALRPPSMPVVLGTYSSDKEASEALLKLLAQLNRTQKRR